MNRYLVWRDHYCYPDSDVLMNRYDIRDQTLLDQAERDVTALTIHTIKLSSPVCSPVSVPHSLLPV